MNVGTEWLVDVYGCDAAALADIDCMRQACERIVAGLNLRVVGVPAWHQFPPPGGITGLYLLTESHLTCHTYPEHRLATFNLYCCRPRRAWPWQEELEQVLGECHVAVRALPRGGELENGVDESPRRRASHRQATGATP